MLDEFIFSSRIALGTRSSHTDWQWKETFLGVVIKT